MASTVSVSELRTALGVDVSKASDELLLMYLTDAEHAVWGRLYPFKETVGDIPERYNSRIREIAVYLFNRRGSEGELAHKENGVDITYESSSVPSSMLADIIPNVGVIHHCEDT